MGKEIKIPSTPKLIGEEAERIRALLVDKNRKYGDSAIDPIRLFSKAAPDEALNVRIDDKLSRIRSAQDDDKEDAIDDLIGYLILKKVERRVRAIEEEIRGLEDGA